ncbi:RNA-binding protein 45-like [Hyposmocoma kahamanoa]|uniref:RNA-binding protein 45-like n=1 Tax=Hyposmocoma kahamanoa TaxID=1477025 RepID=UPI000E6D8BC5|nr:RNA-binding protein 45-like [Hyposmocoma kahamanoa]
MNSRNDERKEDKPPYSRVFVVCTKDLREDDLRKCFERYGEVEDIYMPKDRNTGESRGVAYVKYFKTSSAAAAIQELHLTSIPGSSKPIKVMIAISKSAKNEPPIEKCNRLFIKISKQTTEAEIKQEFSQFAEVELVHIQRDKVTNDSKGLAYVHFRSFLDAAKAFEQCDKKYKPVFATPKQDLKRGREMNEVANHDIMWSSNSNFSNSSYGNPRDECAPREAVVSLMRVSPQNYKSICATCTPMVPQRYLESLFNIVPGMVHCQYTADAYGGYSKLLATYEDEKAASYAVERIHKFEFPSGEIVHVKPDNPLSKAANDLTAIVNNFKNAVDAGSPDLIHLADAIAQASSLIKAATSVKIEGNSETDRNYCSVPLPPPQPMATLTSKVAQRCFIVCKPHPPPAPVLKDVFRRFGDLIDVSTIANKTFGFVKYASARAAQEAITTLHGQTVCGVQLKVMEADDKPSKEGDKSMDIDMDHVETDHDTDRKRFRLNDQD